MENITPSSSNGKITLKTKLSNNLQKYYRVWRLLKKPSFQEFKTISKVSAIGLLVIGGIGFVISVLYNFIF